MIQPIAPDRLFGRAAVAAEQQAFAGPLLAVTAPTPQVIQPIVPHRLWGRAPRAHEYQAHAWPGRFVTPVTPPISGFGPQGVATFVLSLEPGTKVTYSWPNAVFKSYSGNEQRISPSAVPRLKIEGVAFLLDTQSRDVRSAMMRYAARGSVFLLALSFEEVTIAVDSTNTTINLTTTANVDWLQVGQRALVIGGDGSTVSVVIQSVGATTVTIATFSAQGTPTFGTLGNTGLAGARFMPLLQVYLDPQQGFARYPLDVDLWSIVATNAIYGWAGVDAMGLGATVTTYFGGTGTAIANVTENDLIIWDRGNDVQNTASESMLSLTELVDLGALVFSAGAAVSPDWTRTLRYASSSYADWQAIKALLRHCRGNQIAFGLPTGRADLVFLGNAPANITPGGIKVASGLVPGANDYVAWFNSGLYSRLALTLSDGRVQYVTVRGFSDDGSGTLTLTLDQSLDGTVTQVGFLEQVRIEETSIETTWDGGTVSIEPVVRVSRETLTLQQGFLFDKIVTIFNPNTPPLPPTNQAFTGDFGQNTIINWSGDRGCNMCALIDTKGDPRDGMVVCVVNVGGTANTQAFVSLPENTGFPAQVRLHGTVHTDIGNAIWYRYDGSILRWVQFMCTG